MALTKVYWTKQAYECHQINGSCSRCSLKKYNLINECLIYAIVKKLIKDKIPIPIFISKEGYCEKCGATDAKKFIESRYNICNDCFKEKQKEYNRKHNRKGR